MKRAMFLAGLVLTLAGCSKQPVGFKTPQELRDAYRTAYDEGNLDAIMAMVYWDDSPKAIRKKLRELVSEGLGKNRFKALEIFPSFLGSQTVVVDEKAMEATVEMKFCLHGYHCDSTDGSHGGIDWPIGKAGGLYYLAGFRNKKGAIASGDSTVISSSEGAIVEVLETPLPRSMIDEYLSRCANQFDLSTSIHPEDWIDEFEAFSASLVQKADDRHLDSESLGKALELVLDHSAAIRGSEVAYIPVAAYQTTLDGNPVWIIAVKWADLRSDRGIPPPMPPLQAPPGVKSKSPLEDHGMAFMHRPGEDPKSTELVHFRAIAFDQKTLKQVGFISCD